MYLQEALRLGRDEMVALIGAGGKTTTLFRLASELRAAGEKFSSQPRQRSSSLPNLTSIACFSSRTWTRCCPSLRLFRRR